MSNPRLRGLLAAAFAAGCGVVTVGLGAQAAESLSPLPAFKMTGERFDLRTMKGRYLKQLSNCDPTNLLAKETDIRDAQKLLARFQAGEVDSSEDEMNRKLWGARKLVESAIHPDTGELIPRPFRMSGFVPFNGPVCVMMLASQGTPALLFWNWVNQSQNALVNYCNRNASSPTSNETFAVSYCGAVASAIFVAFSLSTFIKRTVDPVKAKSLMKFVAFPSSCVASCSNCYIMRRPEIEGGATISDKDGNTLAGGLRSSAAARKAVTETVMSRALLQFPVFLTPALIMSLPPIAAACLATPWITLPIMSLTTTLSFGFGLPAAVAYFPQQSSLAVSDLEEELQKVVGDNHEVVFYNKGL